ncbi:hypothetical protein [Acidimangrovimonas pyrenivorans]|uniref:Uncharacterized protein n=1 Tax=Acidimangrovimonas pyrenivorans TaxID=2030798 RepID=A0ABV7AGE7_9RHOB
MDQILAIPQGRKRQNIPLMCSIMAVTAILMLSYINVLSVPVKVSHPEPSAMHMHGLIVASADD